MSEVNNKAKSALVPKLRFPEFRDAAVWKLEPMGTLAKRRTVKNTVVEHVRVLTNSAEFGVMDQRDYFEKDIANQGNLDGYYIVEKGDYVYNPRISANAPVGPISKNNIGVGVMSPLYTVFRFNNPNNDFFAHYFKSTHWHHYMRQASSTGARHDRISITSDAFMGLPVPVSTPKEEQKISDCLSSLDELIAAESQKLETLKAQKQGLMKSLMPVEDETVPRLRFPEFRNAKDWKENRLEDLAKRGSGHTPSKAHPEYYGGGIKWVSLADSKRLDAGLIEETETEISAAGIENSSAVLHPAGSVLLSRDAGVGKSAVMGSDMAVSQHFIVWTCKPDRLYNWFLYYSLQHKKPLFERVATGSTIKTIGLPFFVDMKLALPTLPEQKMIADCLASLDLRITAQAKRVDALRAHKKGLVQQLFPALEEVQE
ncbi:restriction endonuclease subunit S [Chitinivorax sp. PXF-14]|uniref:restriction endonuclease subunit S n=1 Tax=Chitinivorax sp. PXF-14 TaxID=3230488 RepID=UPI0034672A1F